MSLTWKQQGRFRPLVARAWAKHCSRDLLLDPADKIAKDKWYRRELIAALGIYSTKDHRASRSFAKLMAHFEAIVGDSVYWNVRAEIGEDRRRIIWWIENALVKIGAGWDYAQGIADQMNKGTIDELKLEELYKIFYALDQHVRRTEPGWKTSIKHPDDARRAA